MRLRLLLKSTLLTALLVLGCNVGWGQTLLVEDFNYGTNAGNLTTITTNWVGFSGVTQVGYSTTGLTMADYISSGIGGSATFTTANSEDVARTYTAQTEGSIFVSFLINANNTNTTGTYCLTLRDNAGAFWGRFQFKQGSAAGKLLFGIGAGSTITFGTTEYNANTTYLAVIKYDFVAGATNDVASLYILSSFPLSMPATPEATSTGAADPVQLSQVAIRQASNCGIGSIDGLRIAKSWDEAVKANTAPIASFSPANASTTGNPDANIVITFDEVALNTDASPIADPTSLITLKETDAAGADVPFTATINAGKTEITIDPTSVLGYNKAYYVAVAPVEDVVAKESVLQSATFTTRVLDVAAPVWTAEYPKTSAIANSDFNLLVNLDEKGKAYYVVLADGGTVPTAAQVKAGTDGADAAALKSGSINVTSAATEFSVNISGLTAATTYDVYVVAEDIELTPNLQSSVASVLNVLTTDTKPEPSNQATEFGIVVSSQTSLTLNWVEATGAQLPASYLILVNETGSFIDPVDGVAQADGPSVINVPFGATSKEVTGLTAGNHYYFKMFSYTNTGTAVDYLLTAAPVADVSLPKLAFTYPNGGEIYYAGDTVVLTWNSANVTNVLIEVSSDNGATWNSVVGPVASDGEEKVAIPGDADYSNQYLLRLIDASNATAIDLTDAAFTIKAVTSNLVDLLTMPNNALVKYVGKATVTYARTARNQKYIQDASGAVLIDDATTAPGFVTGTYAIGDGITNIEGKIVLYNGLVELTPTATTGEPCVGNPVITPEVRTIESLTHLDQCKLVKIEKFSFATTGVYATSSAFAGSKNYDITGYATAVFAFRTLFAESDYIGLEIPLAPVTAVCLVGQFNSTMQITARNLADITSTSADITSSVYTVDFATSVIKDVPEAHSLATFIGNLTPAAGASFKVYDAGGVNEATTLDNTKLVISTAQDGTTTKIYTIVITVYVPSTVATLSKLNVSGTGVNGFLSGSLNYAMTLAAGTTVAPEVTYTLADSKASAVVTNATNLLGSEAERTTKVAVTAEDGTTVKTYSIVFTVYVESSVATLSKLSVNGTMISGFAAGTLNYAVLLPVGSLNVPAVTYILSDAKGSAAVTHATNLFGTEAERTTKVTVTAEDGTVKVYTIVFTVDNTGIANSTVKLNLYPNPAQDEITITGLAQVNRLEIMNITGKLIRNIEITGDEVTVTISDLNKGMYFLKTDTQTLKFIKK
jgi:hypothetical protein